MAPAPSLTELIQTVNDRSADQDALTRVAAAAEVSGEITSKADLLLGHFVDAARHAGRSWAEIGAALGVTKQGAQQRFVDRDAATAADDEHLLVRYTSRARASVGRPREQAREMGHNYVGTEHLLLGVLADPAALSVRVLAQLGIPADELCQAAIEAAVARAPNGTVASDPPFTPRARRGLGPPRGGSPRLGPNYIGTQHLLLAPLAAADGLGGAGPPGA